MNVLCTYKYVFFECARVCVCICKHESTFMYIYARYAGLNTLSHIYTHIRTEKTFLYIQKHLHRPEIFTDNLLKKDVTFETPVEHKYMK